MSHVKPESEREKLPAEVRFDQRVYGGISYAAQALAGSGLTYWIKHSSGRPIYDKIANWLGPNFISKITNKRGAAAIASADYWITVTTMVTVGTMFVAPVKWLEDVKAGVVEKWTKADNEKRIARGEKITDEELQHQEKLLAELKAEPKQSWWTLLTARAASLVPVYTALPLLDDFNKVMEKGFQKFAKGSANMLGLKGLAKSEALHNAAGIAFYDGFYSMISASGLYVYSHFINPPKEGDKNVAEHIPALPAIEPSIESFGSESVGIGASHAAKVERKAPPEKKQDSFAKNVEMTRTSDLSMSTAL